MLRRDRSTTIAVLIACVIIISGFFVGILTPVHNLADQLLSPIERTTRRAASSTSNAISLLGSIASINKENQKLQAQVDELTKQLADVHEVQKENEFLRAQLDSGTTHQYNLAPARILGSSSDVVRTTFQIDKGTSSGISEGMAVIAGSGLVGVIDSVSKYSATVLSVSDPVFKISAITQEVRATGIVSGQLGSGLKMEKISQNDPIKVGETVVTAGSGQVPKGIILGRIESIDRADNAIFQGANIKPAVGLSKLEIVFVVRGSLL